ncbi:MAG: leucyl/phenylalanyl-tRNA--protein transferase [Candidatus Nanopelagicales bacterium]
MPSARQQPPEQELLSIGADLAAGTVLAAYRSGLFPMPVEIPGRFTDNGEPEEALGWWSPNPRGVLRPGGFHRSRSLRRAANRYSVSVDEDFVGVVAGCADPARDGGWIDEDFVEMYAQLHELGFAHSIEVWAPVDRESGDGAAGDAAQVDRALGDAGPPPAARRDIDLAGRHLVGGLFGIEIGGLFCAESKFHRERDASKVALAHLCARLNQTADHRNRLIDVQWATPHLESLGVRAIDRDDYLDLLPALTALEPILTR